MPYINEKRDDLDMLVDYFLQTCDGGDYTGKLNYFLFKLCKEITRREPRYKKFRDFIGELECAKQEILRRLVSDYEDTCIKRNGDVK